MPAQMVSESSHYVASQHMRAYWGHWSAYAMVSFANGRFFLCALRSQGKHKIKQLILWYSFYTQSSKATHTRQSYLLPMDVDECTLDECPIKASNLTRLQASGPKAWKASLCNQNVRDRVSLWKNVSNIASSASQYYPTVVAGNAATTPNELMLMARVDPKMVCGFNLLKQPQQL